jgi:hypothetical protein
MVRHLPDTRKASSYARLAATRRTLGNARIARTCEQPITIDQTGAVMVFVR